MTPTPCPARLWGDADGLPCVAVGPHDTHRYEAADAADRRAREQDQEDVT